MTLRPRPRKTDALGQPPVPVPDRTGKKWMLVLACAGCALCAGGIALWSFNPYGDRAGTRSASAREASEPEDTAEQLTVEGLKKEAFDLAYKLRDEFPDEATPLGLLGMIHYQFNEPDKAIEWWRRSSADNPRFAEGYSRLGEIYLDFGDYEKTVELCRKALAIDPKRPYANWRLGKALLELQRPEEAIPALKAELRHHPRRFSADTMLGQAYMQLNRYEDAIRHFDRAFRKMPDAPRPAFGLAKAYTRLGQPDRADEFYQSFKQRKAAEHQAAVERRKTYTDLQYVAEVAAKIHATAGAVYLKNGQEEVAEKHFRRAARLDKNNELCRKSLADVHMRYRQWPEALALYNQLLSIDPEHPLYHLNKGVILGFMRRLDQAEESLRHGLQLAPRSVRGYHSLLQVLTYRNRNLPEAKVVAERLVVLQPTVENYLQLSKLCQLTGDRAGALAALQWARRIAPDNPQVQQAYRTLQ